eukprot:TRINITY_DN55401_c0_g1_i1.p4 TRINITY_DN55401_c0_g1~~TRINITY_DN55401_c0_g1_i1.p4  ORF type:complete len:100 (-),score=8.98 TRINITY_DN55401_c0_g1_i1:193-492(-)
MIKFYATKPCNPFVIVELSKEDYRPDVFNGTVAFKAEINNAIEFECEPYKSFKLHLMYGEQLSLGATNHHQISAWNEPKTFGLRSSFGNIEFTLNRDKI